MFNVLDEQLAIHCCGKTTLDIPEIIEFNGNMEYLIFKNSKRININDFVNTNYLFRLCHLFNILRGSNNIKNIQYGGTYYDEKTDDFQTLRGSYGPRMLYWVGADDLQEAINKNINVDNPDDYVKPTGIDQIRCCMNDLRTGINVSNIQIFDPAIDFDFSNDIPDLLNVVCVKNGDKISMILNYGNCDLQKTFINDYSVFSFLLNMMAHTIKAKIGTITANIASCFGKLNMEQDNEINSNDQPYDFGETLADDVDNLLNYQKHNMMIVNDESFMNPDVNIPLLVGSLIELAKRSIAGQTMRELAYTFTICSLLRYSQNKEGYSYVFEELYNLISNEDFKSEIVNYSKFCGTSVLENL